MLRVVWRSRESLRDLRRPGDLKDELKDYDISKGTIRFQADKAMPAALVRKLIKARLAENVGRSNKAPLTTPERKPP